MTTSEKLCLKWNNFKENVNANFSTIRDENDFADVTLACEDGQQVDAHKVILSLSSPFFKNILKRNKHAHPLIYMTGFNAEDLLAVVDFLYYGTANVYQENLEHFLNIAEKLQLKGLQRIRNAKGNGKDDMIDIQSASTHKSIEKRRLNKVVKEEQIQVLDEVLSIYSQTKTAQQNFSRDLKELDNNIKSMMAPEQTMCQGAKKTYSCTVCGKEGVHSLIKSHIEANHIKGLSIPCNFCNKQFRARKSLVMHVKRHHMKKITKALTK